MSPLAFDNPAVRDQMAADYVLGTLSAATRRLVEQRLLQDTALQQAIQRWQDQLLPLTALAPPVEPSAQLWPRIQASVGEGQNPTAHAVVRRAPTPSGLQRWWGSLPLWRGLAGTGLAAVAVLAAVLVTRLGDVPIPQYMVVLATPQDKAPGWVVQASHPNGHPQLTLIPLGAVGAGGVPVEKTLQFWTKGADWKGPVSLGLVVPGQTLKIALDKLPPLQPNQLFELTLEPRGGSPVGKPTGPIVFIGRAVKVI